MHRKLTCFIALIIMLAFSARVVVNLKHGMSERKAKTEATETNDGNDDKTEKDAYNESQAWIYHTDTKNWGIVVSLQVKFFNTDPHFILPLHFCAVPTPPPWA